METKCCDPASGGVIQELKIVERSVAAVEAGENGRPACLLFVAVSELNVGVRERGVGGGELLQPDDGDGRRGGRPGVVVYELAADAIFDEIRKGCRDMQKLMSKSRARLVR